jgi:hypothetical protein
MPSRLSCFLILVVWLGFNGWLFVTDLLPQFLPGTPPAFTIDLVEEAQVRRPYIDWIVTRNEEKLFRARTSVDNPSHDHFILTAEFAPFYREKPAVVTPLLSMRKMISRYSVDSNGSLLGVFASFEGDLSNIPATAKMEGEVENGLLSVQLEGEILKLKRSLRSPSITVDRGGSVLMPFHPVNRLRGLSLGQTWTLRVLDPIDACLKASLGSQPELQTIRAKVRPQSEMYSRGRRAEMECFVVDYVGEDFKGTSFVGVERGQVLAQEFRFADNTWVMYRD